MVVSAVVGTVGSSKSSSPDGSRICRSSRFGRAGVQDAQGRGRAPQLQCQAAGEGMALWLCERNPQLPGVGTGLPGSNGDAVVDGDEQPGSHDAVAILAGQSETD